MALINCPECGKEVSDSATTCPHCGYGLKKEKTKQKIALGGSSLSSKITAVNALAIVCQIAVLIILLIVKTIKVVKESGSIYEDENIFSAEHTSTKFFSIFKLSFKNYNKDYLANDEFTIEKGFSGAQIAFVILIVLLIVAIFFMMYEFIKNKLILNAMMSGLIILVTEVFAIILYIRLSTLSLCYSMPGYDGYGHLVPGKEYLYRYTSKGSTMGTIFIILCILCFVLKLISYLLHRENKTETIKTISFKKMLKNLKGAKNETK